MHLSEEPRPLQTEMEGIICNSQTLQIGWTFEMTSRMYLKRVMRLQDAALLCGGRCVVWSP